MYLENLILRQRNDLTGHFRGAMIRDKQEDGRLFPIKGVIAVTALETLALLNLLAVVVFGILGYIKK